MRRVLVLGLLLTACAAPGRTVVLKPDGTWTYADDPAGNRPTGEVLQVYTKPGSATESAKGERVPYALWYDPAKWRETDPGNFTEESEKGLVHRGQGAYAHVIVSRITAPLESYARTVIPVSQRRGVKDAKLVRQERRRVNGATIMHMHMEGTTEGARMVWLMHIYAGPRGVVQVIAFTGQNLFWEHAKDMEELLNGLVPVE